MSIEKAPIFQDVEPEVIKIIADASTENKYPKPTVLFRKGEDATVLYVLKKGVVELKIGDKETATIRLEEAGEVFGWSSLVESGIYTASASCYTDIEVYQIGSKQLQAIFEEHSNAGIKVLRRLGSIMSNRLVDAYKTIS